MVIVQAPDWLTAVPLRHVLLVPSHGTTVKYAAPVPVTVGVHRLARARAMRSKCR